MAVRILTLLLILESFYSYSQSINPFVPKTPDPDQKYIFYLHGGIIQAKGADAVSDYYGKYEYNKILDSLWENGFYVISEVRPKDSKEDEYAKKVQIQIDSLRGGGVPSENIVILGASLGAYIAVEVAYLMKDHKINYALLGLCSDYAVDYYQKYQGELQGRFLSIFESSDSKKSCKSIFIDLPDSSTFTEIKLNMGIDHAFLYKPYQEWLSPFVKWLNQKAN